MGVWAGPPTSPGEHRQSRRRERGPPGSESGARCAYPDMGPQRWWPCQLGALMENNNPVKPSANCPVKQ